MDSAELTSDSAAATERAAEAVATFVRGACRALGVRERVTSPSFTIGRRYEGRIPVSHLDLFRLETLSGEDPGLLSDYLTPDAITFVEWPQAALPELEPRSVVLRVRLVHLGGDRRSIEASGASALVRRLRDALAGDRAVG